MGIQNIIKDINSADDLIKVDPLSQATRLKGRNVLFLSSLLIISQIYNISPNVSFIKGDLPITAFQGILSIALLYYIIVYSSKIYGEFHVWSMLILHHDSKEYHEKIKLIHDYLTSFASEFHNIKNLLSPKTPTLNGVLNTVEENVIKPVQEMVQGVAESVSIDHDVVIRNTEYKKNVLKRNRYSLAIFFIFDIFIPFSVTAIALYCTHAYSTIYDVILRFTSTL